MYKSLMVDNVLINKKKKKKKKHGFTRQLSNSKTLSTNTSPLLETNSPPTERINRPIISPEAILELNPSLLKANSPNTEELIDIL